MKKLLFLLCMVGFFAAHAMQKEVPSLKESVLKVIAENIADTVKTTGATEATIKHAQDLASHLRDRLYRDESENLASDTVTPVLKNYLAQALGINRFILDAEFKAPVVAWVIMFNPTNNKQLVIYDPDFGKIFVSKGDTRNLTPLPCKARGSIAFTKSGLAVQEENSINLYDVTSSTLIRPLVEDNSAYALRNFCYDAAHDRIIFTTETNKIMASDDRNVKVLVDHYDYHQLEKIVCSNTGNGIAIQSIDKLLLYDFATNTHEAIKTEINAAGAASVAYAPNDQIVVFSRGKTIKLLNRVSNRIKTYTTPGDTIFNISYNPDANINEFAASDSNNVYIIKPEHSVQNQTIIIGTGKDAFRSLPLAYNADGTLLAIGQKDIIRIYKKNDAQNISIAEIIRRAASNPQAVVLPATEWVEEDLTYKPPAPRPSPYGGSRAPRAKRYEDAYPGHN